MIDTEKLIKNGNLNEESVSFELKKLIQKKIETSTPQRRQSEINSLILGFIRNISSELSEKGKAALIPGIINIVTRVSSSFGIENVNIPLNIVTDMIDFLQYDSPDKRRTGKQDKRKIVLEAAMVVFSRKGFHDARVDEIAELAGVAKGTVYRYFESKEEILKEIIKGNNHRLVEGLSAIFKKEAHILELIKEAIAFYVEFFESNKDLYKILTHAPWILKEVNEYFYNSIISHLHMIRRRILSLNKEGIIKTTDFYTVFYGIFGFIDGVMQKWFRRNCDYSLKEELPVIIEVLFYGFVGDRMRRDEFIMNREISSGADNGVKRIG